MSRQKIADESATWPTKTIRQAVEKELRGTIDRIRSQVESATAERPGSTGSPRMGLNADNIDAGTTFTASVEGPNDPGHDQTPTQDQSAKPESVMEGLDYATPNRPPVAEMPEWLNRLRDEIAEKWREPGAEQQSEQVINVHIGRVEVRAVDVGAAQQPVTERKPKGVMSLDDYIVQRARSRSQ